MKEIIQKIIIENLQEDVSKDFKAIDLEPHIDKSFKRYSHGPATSYKKADQGFYDKSLSGKHSVKDIHSKLKNAGYRYVHKEDSNGYLFHSYQKSAGPNATYHADITTKKSPATGKHEIFTIYHKTNVEHD